MRQFNVLFLAVVATLSVASVQAAGPGTGPAANFKSLSTSLSPQQRGQAIHAFVSKWGVYVQDTYGSDVHEWAQKMVGQFALGDAINIQRALQRNTFEGAMAELDGVGHRLSDTRAINQLASASSSDVTPAALGDIDKDLVYTPITPCRLVDTRLAGGPVAANTSRNFGAWGYSSYTFQGGSSTNCGMLAQHPTSVVVNVTAVTPSGAGYATVYSGALASPPLIASVNYTAGAIVNNSVMSDINPATSPDFKIYTYAASDFVVDLVGFYDNPFATPLQAQRVDASAALAANAGSGLASPACPAGYTLTGGGCGGASTGDTVVRSEPSGTTWWCYVRAGGAATTQYSWAQCGRVPGR